MLYNLYCTGKIKLCRLQVKGKRVHAKWNILRRYTVVQNIMDVQIFMIFKLFNSNSIKTRSLLIFKLAWLILKLDEDWSTKKRKTTVQFTRYATYFDSLYQEFKRVACIANWTVQKMKLDWSWGHCEVLISLSHRLPGNLGPSFGLT